jgi:hypothetical protein
MTRRGIGLVVIGILCAGPSARAATPLEAHLAASTRAPKDYVLDKLLNHRVVILGEAHWGRADADLVRSLVPELRRRRVTLAMEFFAAELQPKIDALVGSPAWDAAAASEIMRLADWPYASYRDILYEAWETNRAVSDSPPLKVLAMGLPQDFRAKGLDYDGRMASAVLEAVEGRGERVLAYCGMHHAFTRYLQVERRKGGRATEFMTRFGNVLWRKFGEDVFLIALHKAEWCGPGEDATKTSCAPFGGAIDCAAAALARPMAFDVVGSPVAEMKFPASSFYAFGHPYLRFVDYTDGYVLLRTLDRLEQVDLIPLAEFAPAEAQNLAKIAEWKKDAERLARPLDRPGYQGLRGLTTRCAPRSE